MRLCGWCSTRSRFSPFTRWFAGSKWNENRFRVWLSIEFLKHSFNSMHDFWGEENRCVFSLSPMHGFKLWSQVSRIYSMGNYEKNAFIITVASVLRWDKICWHWGLNYSYSYKMLFKTMLPCIGKFETAEHSPKSEPTTHWDVPLLSFLLYLFSSPDRSICIIVFTYKWRITTSIYTNYFSETTIKIGHWNRQPSSMDVYSLCLELERHSSLAHNV